MIEEDGKEREVDMGQPGKWRDPWQGSEKVQCQHVCLRLHPRGLRLQFSVCLWPSSYFLPLSVV